jgi:hypothetical protein
MSERSELINKSSASAKPASLSERPAQIEEAG